MDTQLRIFRDNFGPHFTLGILHTPVGKFQTCEDRVCEVPGRPVSEWKIPKRTAIRMADYELDITMSKRFGKMLPILKNVEGFEGVRIHAGNTHENTEGCILIGTARDNESGSIFNSRAAMAVFQPALAQWLTKGRVFLQII